MWFMIHTVRGFSCFPAVPNAFYTKIHGVSSTEGPYFPHRKAFVAGIVECIKHKIIIF